MLTEDGTIACDKCGQLDGESEQEAETQGWLVDYSADPHTHICPACTEAA